MPPEGRGVLQAVGVVDGLLGQSFLKRFIYTIDETKKQKLILRPRPTRRSP